MSLIDGKIEVIAFDADDTLWVNEPSFREAESYFCQLFEQYMDMDKEAAIEFLYHVQMKNLPLYGYGIKPFILSLIESAILVSNKTVPAGLIEKLINRGKQMLSGKVELIEGVENVLGELSDRYKLVVATKGDLLDQERKLFDSGLSDYFHHIEVVSNKTEDEYKKLISHLDISPNEFLMIGNSLKSDIVPVLNIGAHAFHVPFHTTWQHEMIQEEISHPKLKTFQKVSDLLVYL